MYGYQDIKSIHLEVTSKCQAKCPMCPRRIHGGPLNPFIELEEITLEQFQQWIPEDLIAQLDYLYMCGNLGDPIIAQDTLEIYQYLRKNNPRMSLQMHTNGSARSSQWWKSLAEVKVGVTFGIDGLQDTHHLYRVSTDWATIIKNAKTFIDAGGAANWDMLVFAHNEHQVDDCKQLSQDLGFQHFFTKHTSRFENGKFNVLDQQGKTTHVLYPTTKSAQLLKSAESSQNEILPDIQCKAKDSSQIYISAAGNVSPCCWLDMQWKGPAGPSRIDYMDKIDSFPNLKNQTLRDIFDSGYFDKIAACWSSTGLKECAKNCGSFDRHRAQYDMRQILLSRAHNNRSRAK